MRSFYCKCTSVSWLVEVCAHQPAITCGLAVMLRCWQADRVMVHMQQCTVCLLIYNKNASKVLVCQGLCPTPIICNQCCITCSGMSMPQLQGRRCISLAFLILLMCCLTSCSICFWSVTGNTASQEAPMPTGLLLFLVALEKSAAKGSSASLLATAFVLLCCANRPAGTNAIAWSLLKEQVLHW